MRPPLTFTEEPKRLMQMIPAPWRHVESWSCVLCGRCCKGYEVTLKFNEWANIVRTYGAEYTEPRIDRLCLKKNYDGTCVFLQKFYDRWTCGLQHLKPRACKLWPFKIYREPKYGRPNEASYTRWERRFYVYVDPLCMGIKWGSPTKKFIYKTLPEFVEIGLGLREKQHYSTSDIPYRLTYLRTKEKKKFRRPPPLV